MVIYGLMIVIFAFFYTALVFNSQETADNLKRSGALIPGLRPGKATADYIDGVMTRLTAIGAVYLVAVCLVPDLLRNAWHVPFYFGGTSLLIVVVVVMDFTADQAHLVSHQKPAQEGEPQRSLRPGCCHQFQELGAGISSSITDRIRSSLRI
jgi:preprotein translocase subunit SecY